MISTRMELEIFRSLWGYERTPEEAVAELNESLYSGVEAFWPRKPERQSALVEPVRAAGLQFAPLLLLFGTSPEEQLDRFRADLEAVAPYDPRRIVVHSGSDAWSIGDSIAFYEKIAEVERAAGVTCAHETHRSRSLGSPWSTVAILEAVPAIRLCTDLSHWVLICERLLEDLGGAVDLAAKHTLHLHGRVGTAQAPQVIDPAAPEVETELTAFEGWWEMIWRTQADLGFDATTFTPEYGPPPYQPLTAPADVLAEKLTLTCDWQAERARARFDELGIADRPADARTQSVN